MKKIFLNESEKRKLILEKEKLIMESFAKTFNKIKRIDENEISTNIGVNPSPNYSNNNWNKAIVKIGDKITVSNLPDGEPTRGYENIKIGDVLTITNVRRNANGIVYDTDFSPEYGIDNDDIQSFTNKSKGFGESLNEFEFDMPRKPVTNDDMGKWEDRERMKHRIDGKFNGLNVSNSEDHNRRGELGDGNLVIQTNGNLSPEVESEIANLADSNGWGFESFLDGLYLLFQGGSYGDRFQGVDENDHEDYELEDRKQQYGINPEIDPLELQDINEPISENTNDTYFESLSEALDAVRAKAEKLGFEIDEDAIWTSFGTGGISYETTKSANIPLLQNGQPILDKRGKEANRYIRVSIYRMPSGRYELTMYKTW